MIIYWERKQLPLRVQAGDTLYIAGRISVAPGTKLPFEHVAVVAESRLISSEDELLATPVYGLPESLERVSGSSATPRTRGMKLSDGKCYRKYTGSSAIIGSPISVWNLGVRHDQIDDKRGKYIERLLSTRAAERKLLFTFEKRFVLDPTLEVEVGTNCLGFACSLFEHLGLGVLQPAFPKYKNPYGFGGSTRNFPSPGHLAHALRLPKADHPYCPKDAIEAEAYATASTILREVGTNT